MSTVKPYSADGSKKEQVEEMFDSISGRYDFLNRFFSLGIDQGWRRKVVRMIGAGKPKNVLDVATGTADLAILLSKSVPSVVGLDLSEGMLAVGRKKIGKRGLNDRIELVKGDSEALPFEDGSFDAVTVAFGVRNFGDLDKGLKELIRVLSPGGKLVVLEFSKPTKTPFRQLFRFYFHTLMPVFGRLVSGDSAAYTYLPESVDAFPYGQSFLDRLKAAGGRNGKVTQVTGGIASIYSVVK